jgi:hypothetical protein
VTPQRLGLIGEHYAVRVMAVGARPVSPKVPVAERSAAEPPPFAKLKSYPPLLHCAASLR